MGSRGVRRFHIGQSFDQVLAPDGSPGVVRRWGRISGWVKLTTGRSSPVIDTLLAATAIENDLRLVTRNVRDVAETGASVFNPWEDDPARFEIL